MPTFEINEPPSTPIPDGAYLARVDSARDSTSANDNETIIMRFTLAPGDATIACCLTFVPKAWKAITAFCASAQLIVPDKKGVQVQLTADDCRGRYLYVVVKNEILDSESDPYPKIVRFINREEALLRNPQLSRIALRDEQLPKQLTTVPADLVS